MTLFHKNKMICVVNKNKYEPFDHYYQRCNFVTSQIINDQEDYDKVITYSQIFINHKYLGCEYDKNVMNTLDEMIRMVHTKV